MAWEPKEGQASGFLNAKKQDGEKTPDYRLLGKQNGKLVEIALWLPEDYDRSQAPEKLSGKLGEPRQKNSFATDGGSAPARGSSLPDDDLPF